MATVTRTIIAGGGGDYTTLTGWHNATEHATEIGNGNVYEGVISDNSAYDESITFDVDGTSTTAHTRLTVASANRHDGTGYDTSKARIAYTGTATAAITIEADYLHLEYLQVFRDSAGVGTSDEGIRFNGQDISDVVISRCIITTDDTSGINDTDGIYFNDQNSGVTQDASIDNCLIYNWNRGCVHVQYDDSTPGSTLTLQLDHNTFIFAGESSGSSTEEAPLALRLDGSEDTVGITVTAYNNITSTQNSGSTLRGVLADPETGETIQLDGSHNSYDDIVNDGPGTLTNNWTNNAAATAGVVDTDTANAIIITDTTRTTLDATPQDLANNVILEAGTDRQGNEPDTRQDFSTDIAGNTRPTTGVDVGCYQISAAGGALSETVNDGGTEADAVTTAMDHVRTTNDGGTEADAVTTAMDHVRSVADAGTATDAVTTELGKVVSVSDAGTAADAASTAVDYARTVNDAGTSPDAATAALDHVRTVADAGTATDDVTTDLVANEIDVTVNDGGTATDTPTTAADYIRTVNDGGTEADAAVAAMDHVRSVADAGTATDDVTTDLVANQIDVTVNDGGTEADAATTAMDHVRSEADTGTATDAVVTDLVSSEIDVTVNDGGTEADAATTAMDHVRSEADTGTATDAADARLGAKVTVIDGGIATDSVSIVQGHGVVVADAGTATDAVALAADWIRVLADTGTATDTPTASVGKSLTEADTGTATDAVNTLLAEILGIAELTSRATDRVIHVSSAGVRVELTSSARSG